MYNVNATPKKQKNAMKEESMLHKDVPYEPFETESHPEITSVRWNGLTTSAYRLKSGRNITSSKLLILRENVPDVVKVDIKIKPKKLRFLGCRNVRFSELSKAFQAMEPKEKEQFFLQASTEQQQFLAPKFCKDCQPFLMKGNKPRKNCRHIRRNFFTPHCVHLVLDKMAKLARARDSNRLSINIKGRENKVVNRALKIYNQELNRREHEEHIVLRRHLDQQQLMLEEMLARNVEQRLKQRKLMIEERAKFLLSKEEDALLAMGGWAPPKEQGSRLHWAEFFRRRSLQAKLRFIIEYLQMERTGVKMTDARIAHLLVKAESDMQPLPQAQYQMDSGNETLADNNPPVEKSEGNVNIQLAEEVKVPVVEQPDRMDMFTHKEAQNDFTTYTSRLSHLGDFTWSTSGIKLGFGPDKETRKDFSINVFGDVYKRLQKVNSPLVRPLKHFRFGKFDLEFTFKISSTIMQAGTLLVALTYFGDKLESTKLLEPTESAQHPLVNAAILSQRPFELLKAHDTTEVTIRVPFRHWQTMLSLTQTQTDFGNWNYAKINVTVLNSLMVAGADCQSSVLHGQIYVRMVNSTFTGMIPQATNEMLSAAAFLLASRYLPDPNNDLPGSYENSVRIQPTMSQSFAHGRSNLDHREILRLDPCGNTPHPEKPDDFSAEYIKQVPGLLTVVDWKQSDTNSKILFKTECTPLLEKSNYLEMPYQSVQKQSATAYVMPPVAVWASDKMAFTGGLVFTFDICTTKFSAGMLEVIYVPGELPQNFETTDVSAYMHCVLDIKEQKTYHVATPSIINQPAWYRRYAGFEYGEDYVSPGYIVVRVRQALAATCNVVPSDAKINIFVRGDSNLQCHVLTAPVVEPYYYLEYGLKSIATLKHPDAGIGTWAQSFAKLTVVLGEKTFNSDYYQPVLRYGNVTGGVNTAVLPKLLKFGVYRANVKLTYHGNSTDFSCDMYLVTQTTYDSYVYVLPLPLEKVDVETLNSLKTEFEGKGLPSLERVATVLGTMSYNKHGNQYIRKLNDYTPDKYVDNLILQPVIMWETKAKLRTTREKLSSGSDLEYEMVEAQGFPESEVVRMVPAVNGDDRSIFGEKPVNIKDACRRKQFLKMITVNGNVNHFIADEIIPVCVNYLNTHVNLDTKLQCSNINLYGSGFLSFRGSLVFTILPLKRVNGLLGVQHVPDIRKLLVEHHNAVTTGTVASEVLLQPGYAQHWVDMNINGNLTVEVPFYRNTRWMFAPKTRDLSAIEEIAQCNGALKIFSTSVESVQCGVWYSFGDDASFSYFQGFPPMKFVSNSAVPLMPSAKNQIMDDLQQKLVDRMDSVVNNVIPASHAIQTVAADACNVLEPLSNEIPKLLESTNATLGSMKDATDKIGASAESIAQACTNITSDVPSMLMTFLEASRSKISEIFDLLANFAHVLVDIKNWKHWAIFLVSILVKWGVCAQTSIMKLTEALTEVIRNRFCLGSTNTTPSSNPFEDGYVEPDIPHAKYQMDVDWVTVGALIISGISARSEIKNKYWYMGSLPKLALATKSTAVGFKWVKELFSIIFNFVNSCIDGLVLAFNPDAKLLKISELEQFNLHEWYQVSLCYTNPYNFDRIKINPDKVGEVDKLVMYGQNMIGVVDKLKVDAKVNSLLLSQLTALIKVRDKLRSEYAYGPSLEPFCVWVSGQAGVGKTYVQEHFLMNLLTSQNIDVSGRDMIYTVPSTAEHWERCDNQPVCVYDDFLVYKDDQTSRDIYGTFLALVNKAPFSPPIAECEGKKKLYNPDIVWINANWGDGVDEVSSAVQDKAAFHRRRHVVISASLDTFFSRPRHLGDDISFEAFAEDCYSKFAEIDPLVYEECVRRKYYVEGKEEIIVPPSPHLAFNLYTCVGEEDYVPLNETPLNSLQAAEILNQMFDTHRKKMYAMLERGRGIQEGFKDTSISVIPKISIGSSGKTSKVVLEVGDCKLRMTEVVLVSKPNPVVQEKIESFVPKLHMGELPEFSATATIEQIEAFKEHESTIKDIFIASGVSEQKFNSVKDKCKALGSSIKKVFNQGPGDPSTSSSSDYSVVEPDDDEEVQKERWLKIYHRYNDEGIRIPEEDLTFYCDNYERFEPLVNPIDIHDTEVRKAAFERNKIVMMEQHQKLIRAFDDDTDKMFAAIDQIRLATVDPRVKNQLDSMCYHEYFNPNAGYELGYYYWRANINGKNSNIVMSDQPCPLKNTSSCPWQSESKFRTDNHQWGILNSHIVSSVINVNADEDEIKRMPYYFKETYKRLVKDAKVVKEAQDSWSGTVRKFVLKDVPEWLRTIYNFIRKHFATILAVVGIICTVIGTGINMVQVTRNSKEINLASHVGLQKSRMTPEQLDRYRQAYSGLVTSIQTHDSNMRKHCNDTLATLLLELNGVIGTAGTQIINSGSQQQTRTKLTNRSSTGLKLGRMQGINEPAVEGIKKKLLRNTLWLYGSPKGSPLESTEGVAMRCMGLAEHWAIMPLHYLQWWKDADKDKYELRLMYGDVSIEFPDDWIITKEIPNSGLVLFQTPRTIPAFQDILRYIPFTLEDFDKIDLTSVTLVETLEGNAMNQYHGSSQVTLVSAEGDTPSQKPMIVQAAFEYNIRTLPGTCGSILMCGESLIGMHIAGHMVPRPHGYASALIGDELYDILGWDPKKKKVFRYCELSGDEELDSYIYGKVRPRKGTLPIGTLSKDRRELSIFIPNKTQWQKSIIHGVFPSRKSPAVLSQRDPRIQGAFSPLVEAINKHGLVPKLFPRESFEIAKHYWTTKHILLMKPTKRQPRKLTLEEAICGISGLNYYDKIEFNSSEGWPFCKVRPPGVSGKKWLFETKIEDNQLKLVGINPLLKMQIKNHDEDSRENILDFCVVVDMLKDELKSNDKVLLPGKTRCFSGASVDEVIRFKQYYQDYVAYYMSYRFHNSSAIGMSCVGHEPTVLVNHMIRKGFTKHCCGDYSDFGPAFDANCGAVFYDIAVEWYDMYTPKSLKTENFEGDQIARKNLRESFVNPKHLAVDTIYQTMCGMSSGCPATAPCNTDVNKMYIAIAWLEITGTDLQTFEDNVVLMCYGDDIWFTVSDEYCEIFNNETLHHFFKRFRIKYTDNTKSSTEIRKYCSLEEVEFLKRKFIPHPKRRGEWLAALDKVSIEECANWIQKDASDLEKTAQVVESAMELAYSHGPSYYKHVCKTLIAAWTQVLNAPGLKIRSWEELDKIFYGEIVGETQSYDSAWSLPEEAPEYTFFDTSKLSGARLVPQHVTPRGDTKKAEIAPSLALS
uniref:Genome polyprotein n=1 Tax=Soybean thrips iflavirus 1 TaxID=2797872 RepID=A0A7T7WLU2_9VIRU|nr:polyprotein [Soybean thrips iflavirus 1]